MLPLIVFTHSQLVDFCFSSLFSTTCSYVFRYVCKLCGFIPKRSQKNFEVVDPHFSLKGGWIPHFILVDVLDAHFIRIKCGIQPPLEIYTPVLWGVVVEKLFFYCLFHCFVVFGLGVKSRLTNQSLRNHRFLFLGWF